MIKNIKTTSSLLALAAEIITTSTSKVSGNHTTVDKAIVVAGELNKFRKEVIQRALKVSHYHYGADKGDSKARKADYFGKTYSETRLEHAVKNVIRNRDARVNALLVMSSLTAQHSSTWYS